MASDDDFKLGLQLAEAQNQADLQWQANNPPPPLEIPPPPLVVQPLEIHSNNDNIIQGKRQRRRPVRLQDEATVPSKKRDLTVLTSSSTITTTTTTATRNARHRYDTLEKIAELERDRNDFIHQRDVLQNKISIPAFLVGKPHSNSRFSVYVAKDENKRVPLPTLDNYNNTVNKGVERVISVAEENSFVQKHKHLDVTKKTSGRQELTAESNPIAFACNKEFSHLSAGKRKGVVKKIRKKIGKLQEQERAADEAAAALPPPVLNDDDSDWA